MMSRKGTRHLAELLPRVVGDDMAHFMPDHRCQGILVGGGPKKPSKHDNLNFRRNKQREHKQTVKGEHQEGHQTTHGLSAVKRVSRSVEIRLETELTLIGVCFSEIGQRGTLTGMGNPAKSQKSRVGRG